VTYVFQGINLTTRVAMGETNYPPALTAYYESSMPVPYVSEQMGMRVESKNAAPVVQAGEVHTTTRGDFVTVRYTTTSIEGLTTDREVVQADVGAGVQSLQTVAVEPVVERLGIVEEYVPIPDWPFYSESVILTNPYEQQFIEYAVAPEFEASVSFAAAPEVAAPVYYDTGYTAPVYYGDSNEYVYTPSLYSTASPTQDLIGYGVLDVNGNEVPVYQPDYTNYDDYYTAR